MRTSLPAVPRAATAALACALLAAAPVAAQAGGPAARDARTGLVGDLLHEIAQAETKLLALARAFPDSSYDWRPAAGVRSVREVLVHVAGENWYAAAKWGDRVEAGTGITGTARAEPDAYERRPFTRAEAEAALARSFVVLREGLAALPDSALERPTVYARQTIAVRTAWVRTATHLHEHLGQLIAYARSRGVMPPWSAPAPRAPGGAAGGPPAPPAQRTAPSRARSSASQPTTTTVSAVPLGLPATITTRPSRATS